MEAPRVGARRLIAPKTVSGGLYGPNATRVFCARLYYNFSEIAPTLVFVFLQLCFVVLACFAKAKIIF